MATIVVEDGTVVTGANSYISEADLTTYATDRGVTIAGTKADLLIQSMDYVETLGFKGVKNTDSQPLVWPRANVVIDTYLVATNEIPQLLIDGLAEVALAIDAGNSPLADVARKQQQVTVGSVSVTYATNSASSTTVRKINNKLAKLLKSGGIYNLGVTRG